MPAFVVLKTAFTSAWPMTFSTTSGSSRPLITRFMSSSSS
jgi:hypothetical protein